MDIFKNFLAENKKNAFFLLGVWLIFCIAGVVFSFKISGKDFEDAANLVETTFSKVPSLGSVIGSGAITNLKFLVFVIVSSVSVFLAPLIFLIAGYKGFSSGFCAGVIMRVFSFRGVWINLASIIVPLSLSMPIYLAIYVSALKFSTSSRKSVLSERVDQRRKQWASYLLLQFCLTLCIFIVTIIEAFLNYGMIYMLNK